MIEYSTTVRLLLFPQISESSVQPKYLKLCAVACARVCESYKRLHLEGRALSYSPMATQRLFLSGAFELQTQNQELEEVCS